MRQDRTGRSGTNRRDSSMRQNDPVYPTNVTNAPSFLRDSRSRAGSYWFCNFFSATLKGNGPPAWPIPSQSLALVEKLQRERAMGYGSASPECCG